MGDRGGILDDVRPGNPATREAGFLPLALAKKICSKIALLVITLVIILEGGIHCFGNSYS